jgi:hypothetical protein
MQFKPDLPYEGFYRAITTSLALLPAILDTGAADAQSANSEEAAITPASSRDLAVASAPATSQIGEGGVGSEPQQGNYSAASAVDRSEYMSKRFTSSVLTSLICETPLLSTSHLETKLLSQVYDYLADAGALLGPSDCPLSALAAIQVPVGAQDVTTGLGGDGSSSRDAVSGSSKRRRRRQNARRYRSGSGDAAAPARGGSEAAARCLEALQSGQAALSGVADRLNAQFVGMLKEWLGKGRARMAAKKVQ